MVGIGGRPIGDLGRRLHPGHAHKLVEREAVHVDVGEHREELLDVRRHRGRTEVDQVLCEIIIKVMIDLEGRCGRCGCLRPIG